MTSPARRCVVCGDPLPDDSSPRKKTCKSRCRKRLSRMHNDPEGRHDPNKVHIYREGLRIRSHSAADVPSWTMLHEPRGRGKSRQTLPLEVFDHMPQEAGDWARLLDLTAPHVGFLEPVLRGAATAFRNQRRLVSRMERDLLILERRLEQEMERDGSNEAAEDAGG